MNIAIIISIVALVIAIIWQYRWMLRAASHIRQHGREIDRLEKENCNLNTRTLIIVGRLSEILSTLDKRYGATKETKKAKQSIEKFQKTDRFKDIIHNEDDNN